MDVLTSLSDDQLALLGCGAAFFLFGGLMSLSYYVGRGARESAKSTVRAGRTGHSTTVTLGRTEDSRVPADDRRAA